MDFIRRHKNKFLLVGGAAGVLAIVNKVLSNYEKQWQTSQSRGFVHEARKKEIHFENILNECNITCIASSRKVLEDLDKKLDDMTLIEKLDQARDELSFTEKVKTWDELKIRLLTRLLSEIYSICILVCYLRVQMSVIGGQIYCAAVMQQNTTTIAPSSGLRSSSSCVASTPSASAPSSSCGSIDGVVNMKAYTRYIELLGEMFRERLDKLILPIQETVDQETRGYSLDYKISLQDFSTILDKIKRSMSFTLNGSDSQSGLFSLKMDNSNSGENVSSEGFQQEEQVLRSMLSETKEIFDSNDFKQVLEACIEIGYSSVVDLIVGAFLKCDKKMNAKKSVQSTTGSGSDNNFNSTRPFNNPNSIQLPFAKILPEIRSSIRERSDSDRRSLVNQLLCIDVLNCFAANIFEAFCSPTDT